MSRFLLKIQNKHDSYHSEIGYNVLNQIKIGQQYVKGTWHRNKINVIAINSYLHFPPKINMNNVSCKHKICPQTYVLANFIGMAKKS